MALPSQSYHRMNTAPDLLCPCPTCGETRYADNGHRICRACEGYAESQPSLVPAPPTKGSDD